MMPWDEISAPEDSGSYSVRLAEPDHAYNFYWGKNFQENLVFRFLGAFNVIPFQDIDQMRGITISVGSESQKSHLTLILENMEDESIFYLLCRSLMQATTIIKAGNDEAVARVLITHLLRWQQILQRRKDRELSLNEQAGLFGELLVLENMFLKNLDPRSAVSSWTGPLDDEQDFSYGHNLLEVKTSRASRDRKIKISSVDQLDSVSGQITLAFVGLSMADGGHENAATLNQVVSHIRELICGDIAAREIFDARLIMKGYEDLPAYDRTFFVPVTEQFYSVDDSFPRISARNVAEGITDVSYSITVESCNPWLITKEQAIDRIFN